MHVYPNKIKIVTLYNNFLSYHYQVFNDRNEPEPEPQFVIAAPARGGNLICSLALGSGFATLVIRWYSTLRNGSHGSSMTLVVTCRYINSIGHGGMTGGSEL